MKKVFFLILLTYPVILLAQTVVPSATPAQVVAQVVVQAAPPAWAPPDWVISILNWVQTLPKVGPWIVKIFSILATLSVGMTIVATFVMGLLKALSKATDLLTVFPFLSKLGAVSDQIDAVYEKLVPYLQFFSMYNSKLKLPNVSATSGDSKPA